MPGCGLLPVVLCGAGQVLPDWRCAPPFWTTGAFGFNDAFMSLPLCVFTPLHLGVSITRPNYGDERMITLIGRGGACAGTSDIIANYAAGALVSGEPSPGASD